MKPVLISNGYACPFLWYWTSSFEWTASESNRESLSCQDSALPLGQPPAEWTSRDLHAERLRCKRSILLLNYRPELRYYYCMCYIYLNLSVSMLYFCMTRPTECSQIL